MLPIKLASGNQEEPMSVEESSNEQAAATPEKVCSHTQVGAMPSQTTPHDLITQYVQEEEKIQLTTDCMKNLNN